jgi:quercetin dioxygenase-like cupin family protein
MSEILIQGTEEGLEQTRQQARISDKSDTVATSVRKQVKYVPAGARRSYKSPIDQVTILLTGEQTSGAFFMAEATVPPGSGNPPHIHDREEETFYVQRGTLTVQVGDMTLHASSGDVVQLPRGIAHSFQNNGDVDANFLFVAAPAGLEKFFEEGFYPAADWPDAMPPMNDAFMGRLLSAAAKCGLTFLPPA